MRIEPDIAGIAALFGEPGRAAILTTLFDGRALPAGELARIAGLSLSAASGHLAKLVQGKLLAVEAAGRHRYYRLANPNVAAVLEDLAQLADRPLILTQPSLPPAVQALRLARTCYDHLAGGLAVAIAAALEQRGYLTRGPDRRYEIGDAAPRRWFGAQGVELEHLRPGRQGIARQCLDWTERRPHLAGALGTKLFAAWCERGWLARAGGNSRAVNVTAPGRHYFASELGVSLEMICPCADAPPSSPGRSHSSTITETGPRQVHQPNPHEPPSRKPGGSR